MKKLLNTLYATTAGARLGKEGENLVAEIDGAERLRIPMHMLGAVVVFGATSVSPPLIGALAKAGITLVLLDRQGRFEARVEGPVSGNVLLRRAQYRASEEPDEIVRSIVSAKIANQRTVLQRALRDHGEEMAADRRAAVEAIVDRLELILRRVAVMNEGAESMRGAEGEAANCYFAVFGDLVRSPDDLTSASTAVADGRRWIPLMRCCRSSTRCSRTTAVARPKASASIRRSASCIVTGRGDQALRSI